MALVLLGPWVIQTFFFFHYEARGGRHRKVYAENWPSTNFISWDAQRNIYVNPKSKRKDYWKTHEKGYVDSWKRQENAIHRVSLFLCSLICFLTRVHPSNVTGLVQVVDEKAVITSTAWPFHQSIRYDVRKPSMETDGNSDFQGWGQGGVTTGAHRRKTLS